MNRPFLPSLTDTAFICIDLQERLLPVIHGAESIQKNAAILLAAAKILELPVIATEQYPKGLGPTVTELLELLPSPAIPKTSFSCFGEPAFCDAVEQIKRRHLVIFGAETHVCVQTTVLEALAAGYQVSVIADAVGSRSAVNRDTALSLLRDAGAVVTSTESLLFTLIGNAKNPSFKAISALIK